MNASNYQMNSSKQYSNSTGKIQDQQENTNGERYMHGQQYAPVQGGYPNQQGSETYTMQTQNTVVIVRATYFVLTILILILPCLWPCALW